MFTGKANTTFNNKPFTSPIIRVMENTVHEQVQRLYRAAKQLRKIDKKSAVAKLLNISPQNLNGWEERGISEGGLLKAQEVIGCNALWLRDGVGDMVKGGTIVNGLTAEEISELIKLFEQADQDGRRAIMDMAQAMARMGNLARSRAADDKFQ